ncbi:threonylcarbamoyladenosine tRNA methylthiotransferase [Bacillus rossius redtenbacheri]|uniref:threonylcarbamoyladenosine tRNA methylthiotransferase n=1 Tax=Bacillus rossius redtenbacheri TaxID=93214 RepID=UPI002FDD96F5
MPVPCEEIIEDIEDLISSQEVVVKERSHVKTRVTVRAKRKAQKTQEQVPEVDESLGPVSYIPGTQTVYVKTWGCAHNNSDSEYMAGQLAAYGYTLKDDKWEADLWLLNSCTVKSPAEDHFRNEIEAGQRRGKHIVVAGCVPQGAPRTPFLHGLSVVGVQQIDRVVEVVEETLKGHTVRLLGQKKQGGRRAGGASLALPKVRKNPLVEIIPINTGCLNQCTYCKTKHARGELASYPPDEIVERARQSFSEGVVELWLTSEDTGTYGRDIGSSLPALLASLLPVVPEGCMVRVGMTNPPYILEHLEAMAAVLSHPRVYSFLHVPVQSGSDAVLSDMKREYSRADFQRVVDFLRDRVPGITIATDIICGFPTETRQDFEETLQLCARYQFPSLFINQFFPRPGTPAARMPRVDPQEVKRRTKQLWEQFQSYRPYDHQLGQVQQVLVTELSHDKQHYVAHNKYYHQVLVPLRPELLGRMVRVRIASASKHCLLGEVLEVAGPRVGSWAQCSVLLLVLAWLAVWVLPGVLGGPR